MDSYTKRAEDMREYTRETHLLVGTSHGLFLLTSSDRKNWNIQATGLNNFPSHVYYAMLDVHNNYRLFATDNRDHSRAFLRYSDDFGINWQMPKRSIQSLPTNNFKLADIWYIEPGRASDPHTLYAGTGPACLWTSHDSGETWEANTALLELSEREHWENGSIGTCIHSIIADPSQPNRMWIGISGAGCLRTEDNGQSWQAINQIDRSQPILNNASNEICTSSHRLLQHSWQPNTLYQQNRCGLYKSLDAGDNWTLLSHDLPSTFGFPLAMDRKHPNTLFTLVVDPENRYNIGDQFTVYRSQNAGDSWQALTNGLPSGPHVRIKVLRHGLCTDTNDPCGVYVGTMNGELFASHDNGENWQMITNDLPPIYAVTTSR